MMKEIVKIDLNNKIYGGRVYENQAIDLLKDRFLFRRVFLMKHKHNILNILRLPFLFIKYRFCYKGTLLLTNHTTWLAGHRSKNIVVIHHIDNSYSRSISSLYQNFCEKALYNNKNRFSCVVTVAECWKKELEEKGLENITLIYNSFDTNLYKFNNEQKLQFRDKYGFVGKPLIYLGNCLRKKGIVETYQALKGIDAHFVTTGNKDVELPITHLVLSFDEYRLLLAASDVVITMSLFKEGWNRIAHEAVLCETPVIGSGEGGMKELLDMSGQTICTAFDDLPYYVNKILKEKPVVNTKTVEKYDLTYFRSKWLTVLS